MRVKVIRDFTPEGGARAYMRGELLDLPEAEAQRLIHQGTAQKQEPLEPAETKQEDGPDSEDDPK